MRQVFCQCTKSMGTSLNVLFGKNTFGTFTRMYGMQTDVMVFQGSLWAGTLETHKTNKESRVFI